MSTVVGPAVSAVVRNLSAAARKIVADNIKVIEASPGAAGSPLGDELLPPDTWSHVCAGGMFTVRYGWADPKEERRAMDDLASWVASEDAPDLRRSPAAGGLIIVEVAPYYAF